MKSDTLRAMRRVLKRAMKSSPKKLKSLLPAVPLLGLAAPVLAQAGTHGATVADKVAGGGDITPLQAVILGLVQGLTEFIPVSSSAHLNIVHAWMGHGRELNYDVILSIGTTLALAYFFRKDWKALFTDPAQAKLRNLVFLSCIPAVLLGVVIHKFEDQPPLSLPTFNALMLAVAGFILFLSDKLSRKQREIGSVTLKDALIVGAAQAIALVPGVSRSGSTLTAGLLLGFKREDAARFSFLMSLPISVGAILYELPKAANSGASATSVLLGVVVSAISGFWAIGFLLNYLKTRDVTPFFLWRLMVAVIVFALFRK